MRVAEDAVVPELAFFEELADRAQQRPDLMSGQGRRAGDLLE